jgi:hypothetical protein
MCEVEILKERAVRRLGQEAEHVQLDLPIEISSGRR